MMRILLFGLMIFLLAACNLTQDATEPAATSAPETTSNFPAPGSDLTQIHRDRVMGIMFNYPVGWIIDDTNPPGELIQLYSPSALTPVPGRVEGYSSDQTKIEFIKIFSGSPYKTIDEYIAFNQQPGGATPGTLEVLNRLMLDGDIPAARLQFTSDNTSEVIAQMIFELNGALISVAGYGDTSRFDEVLGTLKHVD